MPILEDEGSVEFENEVSDESTETTDESQENIKNSDEVVETKSEEESSTEKNESGDEKSEDDKTEKGTKLDNDPLSRANQLRANAEARFRQAEEYISYLKNRKQPQAVKPETEEELFLDASKIETTEDLQKYAASLRKVVEGKYAELEKSFSGSLQQREVERTQESVAKGVESIQATYSELREFNADGTKNPSYNELLDKELADQFKELDFDKSNRVYRGRVDIAKLAGRIIKSYRSGKESGMTSAKTKIIDKTNGGIRTNAQPSASGPNKFDTAESFIANAIKTKK